MRVGFFFPSLVLSLLRCTEEPGHDVLLVVEHSWLLKGPVGGQSLTYQHNSTQAPALRTAAARTAKALKKEALTPGRTALPRNNRNTPYQVAQYTLFFINQNI